MFFISLLCIIEWCFVLRIGIIHPQLGLGGDGEIVASRIARALTEIGYEARIYAITFSGGDDIAEAARLIGSSDVKVIYREPSKMLRMLEDRVFKGRFQRLKRLMMFKQLYPTARVKAIFSLILGLTCSLKQMLSIYTSSGSGQRFFQQFYSRCWRYLSHQCSCFSSA